ncbi:MAG: alpha/beta fold hydrolase [Cyanobacteria bacterium J06649_4]
MKSDLRPSLKQPAVPPPPEPAADPLYSPRGAKLATRVWTNNIKDESPRAICLMVPGGGWHSGYFEPLALFLNQKGFACSSYDPVGMGYSEAEPGTPEGCIHINQFDDFVEDIFAAAVWTKRQLQCSADVPIFLIGESFGGLQVLAAGLAEDRAKAAGINLAGIITTGAALEIDPATLPPRPVIKILAFLSRYFPRAKMPATDEQRCQQPTFQLPLMTHLGIKSGPRLPVSTPVSRFLPSQRWRRRLLPWRLERRSRKGLRHLECRYWRFMP